MHFRNRQADDVIDPIVEIGNFPVSAEIVKHVGLGDRDVNLLQIKQIVEVGRGTVGDDRDDAQVVAVVEHFCQLVGERHVGARELPASNPDGPIVLAQPHCRITAPFLQRFRHRLRLHAREKFHPE